MRYAPGSHVRQRAKEPNRAIRHIVVLIPETIELVDFVAVKHKIKIVEVKHVTGNNVWQKLLQRRSAASHFHYGERCWIGKTLELITVEFTVPKEKVLIRTKVRAIAQCDRA